MKTKKRYLAITLLLIFSILLSSCSFVSYIKYTEEQPRELTFDETLDLYLSKIEMLASASIYNQNVYAEYKSFILDAENELNECSSIEELNSVFDKHIYQIIDYALKSHLIFDDYREEVAWTFEKNIQQSRQAI